MESSLSPSELKSRSNRAYRYRAVEVLRTASVRPGARFCMRALDRNVMVSGTADGSAHLKGVKRCASSWACPTCSASIAETRAANIDTACAEWIKRGGTVMFITATLRHTRADDLSDVLALVQKSWSRTFRFKHRPQWYGGQCRAIEVTHGRNGWHPHIHAAIFVNPGFDGLGVLTSMRHDWGHSVSHHGGSTATAHPHSPGWNVKATFDTSGLSDYLCKVSGGWGIGLEIASAYRKSGHKAGRTHMQLLRSAVVNGDMDDMRLYNVYERATAGRQSIVWTPGLCKELTGEELSDEQAVNVEPSSVVTVLLVVPAKAWRKLLTSGRAADLLSDVALLAAGRWSPSLEWPYPPGWTLKHHPSSALSFAA